LPLASPVTHSDWLVREPAPAWGPEGVHRILDRARECGWTRVYWRCFDGGRACYASRLLEPYHGYDPENYHRDHGTEAVLKKLESCDFRTFDALREAIDYGHRIGLEVHAWLSLNEDDHAYGLISRYAREHPEHCWVRRDGRRYRSQLSFAFPEVRTHKLAVLGEILAYGPDGIFLDWIRTGDIRDNPQTEPDGVANYGYEVPNAALFKARFALDPQDVLNADERWVRLRAEAQTVFMRDARALIRRVSPKAVVSVLVQHPWSYRGSPTDTPYADNLRGLLLDLPTWAREGLIDAAVAAGYYRPGGSPEAAFNALRAEVGPTVPVWLFAWIGSADQFRADVQLAERLGATQLLLWESDYIGLPPANAETVRAMGEHARGSSARQ
jgi:uncharacterized lipoprotein YddW (UPF0748 family)